MARALVYAVLAVLKSPDLRAENPSKFHASAFLGFLAKILLSSTIAFLYSLRLIADFAALVQCCLML